MRWNLGWSGGGIVPAARDSRDTSDGERPPWSTATLTPSDWLVNRATNLLSASRFAWAFAFLSAPPRATGPSHVERQAPSRTSEARYGRNMTDEDRLTFEAALSATNTRADDVRWVCTAPDATLADLSSIAPIFRNPGVRGLHQHRVEAILMRLKDGLELDPIVVEPADDGPHAYLVRDGYHRFWTSFALGLSSIPVKVVPVLRLE